MLSQSGQFSGGTGIITFTPTSTTGGTASLTNATVIEGGVVRIGTAAFNWSQKSNNKSNIPYSFTATTFTFGGQVYQMSCGNIVNGVCRSVFLVHRDSANNNTNPNCVNAISAVKQ